MTSTVDVSMVANVDGWTDARTDERKLRPLYRAMPKAGATIRDTN